MTQDETAGKICADLVNQGFIQHDCQYDLLYSCLCLAYGSGYDEGRIQPSHRRRVAQYDKYGNKIAEFESGVAAARKVGVSKYMISKAALGKSRTGGGYYWKYID